jgi:predicted GH43/DUF377 family glycosyl hydrolase
MKFIKRGLIFAPDKKFWWQQFYAILPTPFYIEKLGLIRIFFASTCQNKYGRLTYVDVDHKNPSKIVDRPSNFILDVGIDGAFDDCGVNPSSLLFLQGKYFLYYAGYQRHHKTPYSILSGLAISDDLKSFTRYKNTPILERLDSEINLRSAPTVIKLGNKLYMVYVSDFGWREFSDGVFKGKRMPMYCLKGATSSNGLDWEVIDEPIVFPKNDDEFGFGRPYLIKKDGLYLLFYSIRRKSISYRIGYAVSKDDCKSWVRQDDIEGLEVSNEGWDSEMVCYGAPILVEGTTYLFYNGNNNGESGFGFAELID